MPCYDSRNNPEVQYQNGLSDAQHNSPVAQHLCTVLKTLSEEQIAALPEDVRRWWKLHQERDAGR